jgi:hypothetical protein
VQKKETQTSRESKEGVFASGHAVNAWPRTNNKALHFSTPGLSAFQPLAFSTRQRVEQEDRRDGERADRVLHPVAHASSLR